MKTEMPKDLYSRWRTADDPLALDAEVRCAMDIPENSYYSVGRIPPMEGMVMLTGVRHVGMKRISTTTTAAP